MSYLKLTFFAHLLFLVSCSFHTESTPKSLFSINKQALNNGLLHINLPKQHPKNLAIRDPKGEWFVVQDVGQSIQVIPQKVFESISKLELKLNELVGTTWRESKKSTEIVFKYSGKYLIYFANNLETEPENTFSLQKIISYRKY